MSEDLQRAITAGVVVPTQGGHRCRVCDKDMTEIGPHLRGKDHQNNLAWEALSNPALHQFLPPVVREAKQGGQLEMVDKTHFSYRCLMCTRRPVVNGITPLKTHLNGNEHNKAARMLAASSVSPPDPRIHPNSFQPSQEPPSTQPSSAQNPYPASALSNPDFQPYPPPSLQQPQYPPTYNQQPQYPSSDHLQRTRTPLPAYNHTLQPRLSPPHVSCPQPPAISVPHTSAVGLAQPPVGSTSYTSTTEAPHPNAPLVTSTVGLAQPPVGSTPHTSTTEAPQPNAPLVTSAEGLAQPPVGSTPHTSTTGAPQPHAPLPAPVPQPTQLPCADFPGARGYEFDPELQRALAAEVVVEVPPSFKCRACDKDFNGSAPCKEHLKSDRHKRKAQAWTQQRQTPTLQPQTPTLQPQTTTLQPQTPTLQLQSLTLQPQTPTLQPSPDIGGPPQDGWTRSLYDALPIVGRRTDQVDGSFRWTVVTGTPPFQPSDFVYCNLSMPRGLVLIFNYYFTGQGMHAERFGARQDSFNLKTLFHHMGYYVYLHEDCSKSRTEEILTRTQEDPFLRNVDSFIVFIMSHGKDDQIFYTASGRDEDCMRLDDVRYKFTDTECPALKGKPKLFFINFCRATREQVAFDGISPHRPQPEDMVTVYSCINTFRSPRDPENGTYFVQAWCEVMAAHAHSEDLQYLHHRAGQRLREMGGSVQELQNYSFKQFYFNPVDTR